MRFAVILSLLTAQVRSHIRHSSHPPCKECRNFLPNKSGTFSSEFGKCGLYGEKNLLSGVVAHEYATSVREDKAKCGPEGIDYVAEPFPIRKQVQHALQRNGFFIGVSFLSFLYGYLIIVVAR